MSHRRPTSWTGTHSFLLLVVLLASSSVFGQTQVKTPGSQEVVKWVLAPGYPKPVKAGKEVKIDYGGSLSLDNTYDRMFGGVLVQRERVAYSLTFSPPPKELAPGEAFTLRMNITGPPQGTSPDGMLYTTTGWAWWSFDANTEPDNALVAVSAFPTGAPPSGSYEAKARGPGKLGDTFSLFLCAPGNQKADNFAKLEWKWVWGGDPNVLRIELLDANPTFVGGLTFFRQLSPGDDAKLVAAATSRDGATADGLSLLLVRCRVPEAGRVTFRLDGEQTVGGLLKLTEPVPMKARSAADVEVGDRNLEVSTWAIGKEHYAFCIYLPPKEFGRAHASRPSHRFKIAMHWEADQSGPGFDRKVLPRDTERAIEVVRPPVVLVHGTYDNPKTCWRMPHVNTKNAPPMYDHLTKVGRFLVWTVDYERSNGGSKAGQNAPSKLTDNQRVLMDNVGGIGDALAHFRGTCSPIRCDQSHEPGRSIYAVTQAYVVAHSLGGLVTRVYCRGTPLFDSGNPNMVRPPPREHFDPNRAYCSNCWFHRADNFYRGDVKGIVTISTTHKGSDCPGVVTAFNRVCEQRGSVFNPLWFQLPHISELNQNQVYVLELAVNSETGTRTGAFANQVPNCDALNAIGATPVPAHAIACVCDDEDLDEFYVKRLLKIWLLCPPTILEDGFGLLGQQVDGRQLSVLQEQYAKIYGLGLVLSKLEDPKMVIGWFSVLPALRLRAAVFGNQPNDCTVRQESSLGGMELPKFASIIPHILHGNAPGYPTVQDRVLELLNGPGGPTGVDFDVRGFPPAGGPVKPLPPEARWDELLRVFFESPPPSAPAPAATPTGAAPDPTSQGTKPSGAATTEKKSEKLQSWSGAWDTGNTWGSLPMTLTQVGNVVTGSFADAEGSLSGTVTGRVLSFTYRDQRFGESGKGEFTLSEDGKKFTGNYFDSDGPDKIEYWMQASRVP